MGSGKTCGTFVVRLLETKMARQYECSIVNFGPQTAKREDQFGELFRFLFGVQDTLNPCLVTKTIFMVVCVCVGLPRLLMVNCEGSALVLNCRLMTLFFLEELLYCRKFSSGI